MSDRRVALRRDVGRQLDEDRAVTPKVHVRTICLAHLQRKTAEAG
jgi:hypothetical protein